MSNNTSGGGGHGAALDPTAGVLSPRARPDTKKLLGWMTQAMGDSTEFCHRMEENDRVRNCVWSGQSEDGRKHADDMDEEPMPYEGASDARIRVAALLIRENKKLCRAAMVGGRVHALPVDAGTDPETAAGVKPLLEYLMRRGKVNVRNASDYLLDWRSLFGHAVLGIDWRKEMRLEKVVVTVEELVAVAVKEGMLEAGLPAVGTGSDGVVESGSGGGQGSGEVLGGGGGQGTEATGTEAQSGMMQDGTGLVPLPASGGVPDSAEAEATLQAAGVVQGRSIEEVQGMLLDVGQHMRLVELLMKFDALMPESEAARAAGALRKDGAAAVYYRPYVHDDGPEWTPLCPMKDVFYPVDTKELKDAPWVVRVHWDTEARLRDRAAQEAWDKTVLEEVIRKGPGTGLDLSTFSKLGKWVLGGSPAQRGTGRGEQAKEETKYQWLEVFYVASSVGGASCLYREVVHGKVPDKSLLHEPLPHWHGRMPFVEFRRMREGSEFLLDAEGVPEEVRTAQNAIKFQHDGRTNRTDLTLSPPATVPFNRGGGRFNLGPNAQIPMRRSGTLEFMKLPQMDMDTVAITTEEWKLINLMYGRGGDGVSPEAVLTYNQTEVDDWLTDLGAAWAMTYDLCQEKIPDEAWELITGSPKPARDRRRIDFSIAFDVRDLNIEALREKLELLSAFVVPNDSEGVIDRAGLAAYVFAAIDPVMAKRLVRSGADAAQREEEDELTALAVIMSGEEPPQKEGQNHGLRAAVLKRAVGRSLEVQSKLMSSEQIRKVYQARLEYHENQVQQQQNAIIGRTMQQPVLGAEGSGRA